MPRWISLFIITVMLSLATPASAQSWTKTTGYFYFQESEMRLKAQMVGAIHDSTGQSNWRVPYILQAGKLIFDGGGQGGWGLGEIGVQHRILSGDYTCWLGARVGANWDLDEKAHFAMAGVMGGKLNAVSYFGVVEHFVDANDDWYYSFNCKYEGYGLMIENLFRDFVVGPTLTRGNSTFWLGLGERKTITFIINF